MTSKNSNSNYTTSFGHYYYKQKQKIYYFFNKSLNFFAYNSDRRNIFLEFKQATIIKGKSIGS
jgi:hypothetical protein